MVQFKREELNQEGGIMAENTNKVQVILSNPPSKSNSYRIIRINGHGSLAKTSALKAYEKSFYLQCNHYRNKGIEGLFELHIDAYLSSQRQDLDNVLKGVLDCLEQCGAVKNDRNCTKIVANKFIDKEKPRIEFKIVEV